MNITKVKVTKIDADRIKALATVTLDDSLVLTGIKVVHGQNGMFISMPSRKTQQGEYKDIYFPVTAELRQEMQEAVLAEYERQGGFVPGDAFEGDDNLPF